MLKTVGSGNQQWENVFENPGYTEPSNAIIGLQGQRAGGKTRRRKGGDILSTAAVPLALLGAQQMYGRKKQEGGVVDALGTAAVPLALLGAQQMYGRKKQGGFADVLSTAAVPVALLGMQQTYGRKKRGGQSRTRSRRGGIMDVLSTAAVPVTLLAAQQTYGKKKRGGEGEKLDEVIRESIDLGELPEGRDEMTEDETVIEE